MLSQPPQAQVHRPVAIVTHDQGPAVAPGHEAVVAPAVDLHLVLVEGVDQIPCHHPMRQRIAVLGRQGERRIDLGRQVLFADMIRAVFDHLLVLDHAAPDRRQAVQNLAVAVALNGHFRRQGRQGPLQSWESREQIVEAAVLGIDHHDRLDGLGQAPIDLAIGKRLGRGRSRAFDTHGCAGDTGDGHRPEQTATGWIGGR